MEIKTVIEIETMGDFDPYIVSIMVSSEEFDVEILKKEFCQMMSVDSINVRSYDHTKYDMIADFKSFLLLNNFTELKRTSIFFH